MHAMYTAGRIPSQAVKADESSVQQPTSPNAANHNPIRRASESGSPSYRRDRRRSTGTSSRGWARARAHVLLYGYAPWCDTQKMGIPPGHSKLRVRFVDDIKYDGGSPLLGKSWRTPFYLLQTRTPLISVHKGSPTQYFSIDKRSIWLIKQDQETLTTRLNNDYQSLFFFSPSPGKLSARLPPDPPTRPLQRKRRKTIPNNAGKSSTTPFTPVNPTRSNPSLTTHN
jgi:hypothetical protein